MTITWAAVARSFESATEVGPAIISMFAKYPAFKQGGELSSMLEVDSKRRRQGSGTELTV